MLAVVHKSVAKAPAELVAPDGGSPDSRCHGSEILAAYKKSYPDAMAMHFDRDSFMAFSHSKQALLRPRTFCGVDDVYCMFMGMLENLPQLRHTYGLSKMINEVQLITEMYRVLRDRGPYSADQVIQDLSGPFAFVLYDNKTKTLLVACDPHGKVPFYWGIAADGTVAFSDDAKLLKQGCGKSFAPFPQGCYFSSAGLHSFAHPMSPLKPVPRVDSEGQMCGSIFKVDSQSSLKPVGHGITFNLPVPHSHH
ncbi:stem-specific protein TSJT1 [Physcomitrium patens]|uniref:DUF3700 domain-containing protein n=1 Tax=Physcomitrium patens TaxID=3218 RepID=A0A2K1L939_PHYPA|nr:stem-specific protein TSJT1-like [Physcomitrium patens]XP_024391645.1 stem-specific protein TSJT1-like [Physcomitrium patens]PNR62524.1 hypothetical protein PHYPA_000948 [Physcomitrium patens]|eukprot:XP_024391635.1 stem-specific protein TSJT1-like [Physcomitrella patens]